VSRSLSFMFILVFRAMVETPPACYSVIRNFPPCTIRFVDSLSNDPIASPIYIRGNDSDPATAAQLDAVIRTSEGSEQLLLRNDPLVGQSPQQRSVSGPANIPPENASGLDLEEDRVEPSFTEGTSSSRTGASSRRFSNVTGDSARRRVPFLERVAARVGAQGLESLLTELNRSLNNNIREEITAIETGINSNENIGGPSASPITSSDENMLHNLQRVVTDGSIAPDLRPESPQQNQVARSSDGETRSESGPANNPPGIASDRQGRESIITQDDNESAEEHSSKQA